MESCNLALSADLETARMQLITLTADHSDELYSLLQDDRLYVFIPSEPPASIDNLRKLYTYKSVPVSPDRDDIWLNWVAKLKNEGQYVGQFEATVYTDQTARIAYSIFPGCWQNGYAKEGMEAVCSHLKNAGTKRLIAEIDTRNIASIKLVESLGFSRTKLIENADEFKGSISDEFVYEKNLDFL